MRLLSIIRLLLIACFLYSPFATDAQDVNVEELLAPARIAAFEQKDRVKAIQLAQGALLKASKNAEVEIFLGRLYTWNNRYDSAYYHLNNVLSYNHQVEDAYIALADLEYWNDKYNSALIIVDKGLSAHPNSEVLQVKKAKVLIALRSYKEASKITTRLLKANNKNTEVIALASSIRDAVAANKIGVTYDYVHFDKQFDKPWQSAGLSYTRQTKMGAVTGNLNYANRFGRNGWQAEVEAYPNINKTFYSYVSIGYSPNQGVFPKYRAGVSLYANLPKSFEAEAGIRYLNFGSSTYIYTFYAGKYIKNLLFSARTFITPSIEGVSQVYFVSGRYYFKTADDYIGITLGTGVSPDDRSLNVQYSDNKQLQSKRASFVFNHSLNSVNIITLRAGWLQEEADKEGNTQNQLNFSMGVARRF